MRKQDGGFWTLFAFFVLFIVIVWLVVLSSQWRDKRSHDSIQTWSQSHGYEARNITRWYIGSPFWFWRGKHDDIFQADLVRDGRTRLSYFRIRPNLFWGNMTSQKWENGTSADE
jgi:hypothetical protein